MYRSDDDKIVSISFDNKQFLSDVNTTLKTLDQLNDATSERNLNGRGLNTLSGAFNSLGKEANDSLSGIDDGFRKLSVPERLSQGLSTLSLGFNALEAVALGALTTIGRKAAEVVMNIPRTLTSGIRDGWSEYNLLIDSTQTLLVNTEKYGTTINDVTKALDELNDYADLTIYNFAQMTRNMGYFTTSGMNLDEAQNMVTGMANLAALFGANNENLQRAMYQTSQAMSAGVFRKMDWNSLRNAQMSGTMLQEELIRTAAFMSGKSYEEMNDYIQSLGGFYDSLDSRNGAWLTADVFSETMRRFAGMTREELEMLRDVHGNALSEEEIDRIVQLGERGLEAAQVVRTLGQMLDSVKESIGSGWTETFRLIIGNLEQAKDFWSPINKLITEATNGISDWRNSIVKSWADVWRVVALEDMKELLNGLGDVLRAIGEGFSRAFGSTHQIAGQIGRLTEALGDFATTLRLDEEELADLTDFVDGILSPITLLLDIFREITIAFFNAGDAMNEFDTRTDSIVDNVRSVRKVILQAMGIFGRIMSAGREFIRQNDGVRQAIRYLVTAIRNLVNIIERGIGAAIIYLYNLWERYDMTSKVISFCNTAVSYLTVLKDVFLEVGYAIYSWFNYVKEGFLNARWSNPIQDIQNILLALKDLFIAIIDPTISVSDAFNHLKEVLGIGAANTRVTLWNVFSLIKDDMLLLFETLRDTPLGGFVNALSNVASIAYDFGSNAIKIILNGVSRLGTTLKNTKIGAFLEVIKNAFASLYNYIASSNIGNMLLTLAHNIFDAIVNFIETIGDGNIGLAVLNFISNIKSSIETAITFRRPNVITAIETVADNIHNATSKLTDFAPFVGKLDSVRNVVSNVKDVIESLKPTENSEKLAGGASIIKDILDFVEPVSDQSGRLGKKIKDVTDTLNSVASIDADKASENTQKIAIVIAGFVGIFKYLVDMFLTIVSVLSIFNFSKWSSVIQSGFESATYAISNGLGAIAQAVSTIAKEIGGAIKSFGLAAQEQAKAEKFKAVADIFKTIAILIGVIFVGVALISQFGDPEKFASTMMSFGLSLVLILGTISLMMGIIMTEAGTLVKKCGIFKISTFATMIGLSIFMVSIRGLMNTIMMLTAAIVVLGVIASRVEDQDAFYNALKSIMMLFTFMTLVITTMTFVFTKLAQDCELLDVTGIFGTPKTISTLTAAAAAMSGIMVALSVLIMSFAAATFVLSLVAKNQVVWNNVTSALGWLIGGLLGVSTLIALIGAVAPETSILFKNIALTLLGLSAACIGFGIAVSAIILAIGLVGDQLLLASTAFVAVLSEASDVEQIVKPLKDILLGLAITMGVLVAGLVAGTYFISKLGPSAFIGMAAMLSVAIALIGMSKALAIIAVAISGIVVLNSKFSTHAISKAFKNMRDIFGIMALSLLMLSGLGAQFPMYTATLLVAAAAIVGASTAFIIISHAIRDLVRSGDIDDISAASDIITDITMLMIKILGGLSVFGTITGGLGIAVVLAAAGAMIAVAEAINIIGKALKTGAEGFYVYANAASLLEKVNIEKVYDKILRLSDTIPEVLRRLNDSMGDIAGIVSKGIVAVANGLVQGLYAAYEFLGGIISANSSAIIEFFGGILVGLIVGVVNVVKIAVTELCKENGPLWEILLILGEFAVDASDYIGYYGFMIAVGFFQGVSRAIEDLGWDVYIGDALGTWWANVQLTFAQKFGYRTPSEMFAAIGLTWGHAIADNFVTVWRDFVDAILIPAVEQIEQYTSWMSMAGGAIGVGGMYLIDNDTLESLTEYSDELAEMQDYANIGYNWQRNNIAQQAIMDATDALKIAQLLTSTQNEYLEQRRNARSENVKDHDYYDPDRYTSIADTISDTIGSIFNNNGESVFDRIGNFLGLDEGETISDRIGSIFGFGGSGTSLSISDSFGTAGTDAATAFGEGFSSTLSDTSPLVNVDDISGINNDTLGKYTDALRTASELPDDVRYPVISPVLDDSEFKDEAVALVNWWNGKTYDQFAVDTGKSMLVREESEGDATTDGNVSISYTQINNSPKELSPIEVYRDTKNLLRGSGKFVLS